MNVHADLDEAALETPGVPLRRPWLRLGGPWPITIKIILLKLFGLGLLLSAVLSHLALREHSVDSVTTLLNTEADALTAMLRDDAAEGAALALAKASGTQATLWALNGEPIASNVAPLEEERPAPPDVASALAGERRTFQSVEDDGDIVVSIAAPVRDKGGSVVGALTLRSADDAVLGPVRAQERDVITLFGIGAVVLIINALILALIINRRLVRLAQAAERVRGGASVYEIPEPYPTDTVGELACSFRAMAIALTRRMAATEAFAADVAHELKSPLTSLRSAVETLPVARSENARDSLLEVIAHDVRRIDRLISDIADASRLDRELSRAGFGRVDLGQLLQHVVATEAELAAERGQCVTLDLRGAPEAFLLAGNELRLSQVFINLLDNARSFASDGGRIGVVATRFDATVEVVVDDDGPGMDERVLERIFERFYTDRSGQASFGDHSGLGLAISRQIVTAHGGEIAAENRRSRSSGIAGARFIVRLPVAEPSNLIDQ